MQIHLSKPGGQREGPFTVEQVNRDLAAGRYNDNDYWAWYEGLASWIPLHSVPGIKAHGGSTNQDTTVVPKVEEEPNPQQEEIVALEPVESAADPVAADECDGEAENEAAALTDYAPEPERETESRVSHPQNFLSENQESQLSSQPMFTTIAVAEEEADERKESNPEKVANEAAKIEEQESAAPDAELTAPRTVRESKVFSGLRAEALEQIFVFTSGEGPSIRQSGVVAMMMLEMVGEDPDGLRQRVSRDVFGKCNVGERIRADGKVPGAAWRAMSALRPELVGRAKAGEYRTCVRTFTTEADDLVAIFLFYNKATLKT